MSVEVHPPTDVDKGSVLRSLAQSHVGPVLFIGDDVGDLPAFDALDSLAASGTEVFRIFVQSEESDAELLERADLVVDGPEAVLLLLQQLQTALNLPNQNL
jgi:trehalose 6-phosphate phosphatase